MFHSHEADLFIIDNTIIKIYHSHVNDVKKRAEFYFLTNYQHTDHVPTLFSTYDDLINHNQIVMQYMKNYITLNHIPAVLKSLPLSVRDKVKQWLAEALFEARRAIGLNTYYTDLHLKNILIDMDRLHVVFIDPGKSDVYYDAWKAWVIDVSRQLHISKIMKQVLQSQY